MDRHQKETVPFTAGDGRECTLVHVTGQASPTRGPVVLVHGAGVRSKVFQAPVERTLVDVLVDDGFDVWLENWRASIDFPPNEWTLDQAAVFDHPQAIKTIVDRTGSETVQAVIHCQGSTSFMMSAVAGLLPEVTTIVSNAVSLHPVVPTLARWKIEYLLPFVRPLTPYIDPEWGLTEPGERIDAPFWEKTTAAGVVGWVRLAHRECNNTVCRMVSFTYGVGAPTLWSHENLNDETHEWLKREFGHVPLTFFAQMARCVRAGHLVSVDARPELPENFVAQPPQTDARFAFFAGDRNRCFLHDSQERTFAFFDSWRPNYHTLRVLPNYGHLDVFMGQNAARDVFPLIRDELVA
jgi:pimeloyl-ACP methyl ester carboxylesterase